MSATQAEPELVRVLVSAEEVRLYRAAPELLAACVMAANRLEGGTAEQVAFNAGTASVIRAAIAKATGKADV